MTSYTIPTVETERLILRAPHENDLPAMTAFFETERSHMVGGPKSQFEVWRSLLGRFGYWALYGYGGWHITEKTSNAFAGWVGMIYAPGWDEHELGWTLMEEFEGKGLAYEAALAARDYSARHLNLDGVISYIAHSNSRSRALAERLGATYEREGELLGKPCQVWRHPKIAQTEPALTTERTGQ
ncbi:GNAT family N-acetyltransferase [Ruegeria sp. Ofav3-42]|uniref:GNAT family N-acetyltransferase n=1 Tax=Ruegeria sp. Ofav3-42 TaxID=2917759 RepID=UPI001EF75043|nr:GNAT family N-acetyltransferase [Ruegeria sp. Ofav3-42]MCG7522149.1 GNAT family N-acetyltransferase [Ruegeria sp. Ofav3-42]